MSDRIYPIYHKEKKIYFSDWTNLKTEAEAMAAIEETTAFIEKLGEYNLLEIIDVSNSITPAKTAGLLMESAKRTKKYSYRKAVVGVTGLKVLLLKGVNKYIDGNIKGFDSVEGAREWIVQDQESR